MAGWRGHVIFIPLVFLLFAAARPAVAQEGAGKGIFATKQCGECHDTSGPLKVTSIADREKLKGPALWFAGSKFQEEWLKAWLAQPISIRGVKWGTLEKGDHQHPALTPEEANKVAAYLMTLTDQYVKTGVIPDGKKMLRSKQIEAKNLFEKKQACFACHKVKVGRSGRIVGGLTGPDLTSAGSRLKGDWVYSFLKSSQTYEPFGRMPVFGDKALNKLADKDLQLLAEYVANFK